MDNMSFMSEDYADVFANQFYNSSQNILKQIEITKKASDELKANCVGSSVAAFEDLDTAILGKSACAVVSILETCSHVVNSTMNIRLEIDIPKESGIDPLTYYEITPNDYSTLYDEYCGN